MPVILTTPAEVDRWLGAETPDALELQLPLPWREINVRVKSKKIDKAGILDDLDEALTNSSKVAATFGDELLVYLIDMAVLHVRKKAIHLNDRTDHRLQDVPYNARSQFRIRSLTPVLACTRYPVNVSNSVQRRP